MLMQLWRPEFEMNALNSGTWYHCLPIRTYHWVVGCWCGHLSEARCRFAYAQLMPLPLTISCSSKSRLILPSWFYLSGAGSLGWSWTKSREPKTVVVVVVHGISQLFQLESNQTTGYASQRTWCLSQARKNWDGCGRKGIWHKNRGEGDGGRVTL